MGHFNFQIMEIEKYWFRLNYREEWQFSFRFSNFILSKSYFKYYPNNESMFLAFSIQINEFAFLNWVFLFVERLKLFYLHLNFLFINFYLQELLNQNNQSKHQSS